MPERRPDDLVIALAEVIATVERQPLGDPTHRRTAIARAVIASGLLVPRADDWEWGRQFEPGWVVECDDETEARREVQIDRAKKWHPETQLVRRPLGRGEWEVYPDEQAAR